MVYAIFSILQAGASEDSRRFFRFAFTVARRVLLFGILLLTTCTQTVSCGKFSHITSLARVHMHRFLTDRGEIRTQMRCEINNCYNAILLLYIRAFCECISLIKIRGIELSCFLRLHAYVRYKEFPQNWAKSFHACVP